VLEVSTSFVRMIAGIDFVVFKRGNSVARNKKKTYIVSVANAVTGDIVRTWDETEASSDEDAVFIAWFSYGVKKEV
jgi:hypothetical protein